MKIRNIIIGLILVICAEVFNLWYVGAFDYKKPSTLYSNPAEIIEIENDIVTVKDNNDYLWTFYGAKGRQVGDSVVCIMNTCKTSTILDDEIINVTFEK